MHLQWLCGLTTAALNILNKMCGDPHMFLGTRYSYLCIYT